jgi:hypothetical protein
LIAPTRLVLVAGECPNGRVRASSTVKCVSTDRYADSRWTFVLDSFVLWTIGFLDEQTMAGLDGLTPKLRKTFGMDHGTWQDVVMQQMDFDDEYVKWLREKWRRQLDHDRSIGQEPNPTAWAQAIVDFISTGNAPSRN